MSDHTAKSSPQNPADVAREAFRRLATRRIAPTPNAYRDIYDEITGTVAEPGPDAMLGIFAARVADAPGEVAGIGQRLNHASLARDWQDYGEHLVQLLEKFLIANHAAAGIPVSDPQSAGGATAASTAPVAATHHPETAPPLLDGPQARLLRELLTRTLSFAVASLLQGAPELAAEADALALSIKDALSEAALTEAAARLKQLCFKIELKSGDLAEQHELLLRLFKLLLENVSELVEDDAWLSGQIAGVQNLLAGPISHNALKDATRSLKEVIYKQGILKHSLHEAKITVKNMMITFIDRLGAMATTTSDYHENIDKYSKEISQAQDIGQLNEILNHVMHDTRATQLEALRSRDEMIRARKEVHEAEARIVDLESKLEQMSELVREDQLTGSLNRRGLDDVFERELARSDRRASPLCVAMLDLDDFKRLNDTHGHQAGDQALVHLVRVIKDTLRTMDVIARFGGEEFLILLPDTPLEDAKQTVTRLQRELTKRIFMHNNERVLMTFSAGVALRAPKEDQAAIVERADKALYEAKKAGKNRVVAAA